MLKLCAEIWAEVRGTRPLVHCITNYVTINDVANIILAAGASPAMVEHPDEAGQFAALARALYLNVGTLTGEQEAGMLAAAQGAALNGVPITIDPVAYGVIPRKQEVLQKIKAISQISAIKGNTAEIKNLAGLQGQARGVDSLESGEGLTEVCRDLAGRERLVIAATGEVDIVACAGKVALIKNGTALFREITGAGCMAGGVVAACIGTAPQESWLASVTALCAFNIAGERAASLAGNNPGSFRTVLFDQLYHLKGEDLLWKARIDWNE